MNAAQRSLGEVVVGHQGQAVEADAVDRVNGLENAGHPLEALKGQSTFYLLLLLLRRHF